MVTKDGLVPVKGGQYTLLSDDQIQDLHHATIEVLHDVGIKVMHNDALDILKFALQPVSLYLTEH